MMDQNFLSLLLSQVVQVTILAACVWCATRCFAKNRPHLAHALWLLVLLKCVTPPICHNPVSPFCWSWSGDEGEQVVLSDEPFTAEMTSVDRDVQSLLGPFGTQVKRANEEDQISSSSFQSPTPDLLAGFSVAAPEPSTQFRPGFWLIGLWLIGVALIAAIAMLRSVLFLRWLRTFPRRKHDALSDQLDRLARKLGVKRKVRLEIVDGPVGPAVFGFLRPRIVLPQAIVENQTPSQLEPLLAHELIHLRRGDLWWSAVQLLATCAFWFHPLVWLASKKVSRESERSCDEETVASLGCCPTEYARCLLDVLEKKQLLRAAPVVPGIRQVDITSARLERVMTFGNGIRRTTPLWIRLAFVVMAIVVLPGAAAAVQQEAEEAIDVEASVAKPLVTTSKRGGQVPFLEELPYVGRLSRNAAGGAPIRSHAAASENVAAKAEGEFSRETREYDIAEMLKHLESADLKVSKSELIENWIGRAQPIYQAAVKEVTKFNVRNNEGEMERHELPVVETKQVGSEVPELKFDLQKQKVTVSTTKKLHERLAKDVKHFSQFGFHQVVLETRFLSADRETWESLEIPWETALSVTGKGEFTKQWNDQSAALLDNNARSEFEVLVSENAHVLSNHYVQKNAPTLFSILDDQKVSELVRKTKGNNGASLFLSPKIVTFNGWQASVTDAVIRPFVTSLVKIEKKGKSAMQPVISQIPDGTRLTMTPVVSEDKKSIKIDSELVFSQILSVDTFTIPRPSGGGLTIQVPEVDITSVATDITLQDSKTLAISLLRKIDGEESGQLVVLVTCRIVAPAVLPEPLNLEMVQPDEYSEIKPPVAGAVPVMPPTIVPPSKFKITTSEPQRKGEDYQRLKAALLANNNFDIEIAGHVDYEIDDSKITVRGNGLAIDNGFPSYGDKVTLVLTKDDLQFDFRGNVRFNFDGVEIGCQRLSYGDVESDRVVMEGDVSFAVGQTAFQADLVTFDFSTEGIQLVGNAKIIQKDQAMSFVAEKIVYDMNNETVKLDDASKLHHLPLEMESPDTINDAQVLPTAYYLDDDVQSFTPLQDASDK